MKTLDLKPTQNNLLEMFLKDSIGRNEELYYFVNLLNSIEDNVSIAINAQWGSGKTFFVKQTKLILDAYNNLNKDKSNNEVIKNKFGSYTRNKGDLKIKDMISVYYDAWENDNDIDPVLSIIYNIYTNSHQFYDSVSFRDRLLESGKCLAALVELVTGRDLNKFFKTLKNAANIDEIWSEIQKQKKLKKTISNFFDSFTEDNQRLVIFIDELDRCRPSFAVKLLERIKHYFDNDKITFVFSINALQLQHTIKKYYGNDFDAHNYLDRFFDFYITLLPVDTEKYCSFLGMNLSYDEVEESYKKIIDYFEFQLREINKFYSLSQIAIYKIKNSNGWGFAEQETFKFCIKYIVPFIIALRIKNIDEYYNFINGKDSQKFADIILKTDLFYLDILLGNNETYYEEDNGNDKILVTREVKLKQFYELLFNRDKNKYYKENVGNLVILSSTGSDILKAVSFVSSFADYTK